MIPILEETAEIETLFHQWVTFTESYKHELKF